MLALIVRNMADHSCSTAFGLGGEQSGTLPGYLGEGFICSGFGVVMVVPDAPTASPAHRNGNWKMASRDWRQKPTGPGPKLWKLPTRDSAARA